MLGSRAADRVLGSTASQIMLRDDVCVMFCILSGVFQRLPEPNRAWQPRLVRFW